MKILVYWQHLLWNCRFKYACDVCLPLFHCFLWGLEKLCHPQLSRHLHEKSCSRKRKWKTRFVGGGTQSWQHNWTKNTNWIWKDVGSSNCSSACSALKKYFDSNFLRQTWKRFLRQILINSTSPNLAQVLCVTCQNIDDFGQVIPQTQKCYKSKFYLDLCLTQCDCRKYSLYF